MKDICPSVAKNEHIHIKMLHQACIAVGGERRLAAHLGVSEAQVHAWLNGRDLPPDPVFLRCLDLIAEAGVTKKK